MLVQIISAAFIYICTFPTRLITKIRKQFQIITMYTKPTGIMYIEFKININIYKCLTTLSLDLHCQISKSTIQVLITDILMFSGKSCT